MNESPIVKPAKGLMADRVDAIWPIILDIRNQVHQMRTQPTPNITLRPDLVGEVLLNRYMFEVCPDPNFEQTFEGYLDTALNQIDRMPLICLHGGIVGVGWLLAHLSNLDGWEHDIEELEENLLLILNKEGSLNYDIISGIVGLGFYALERLPHANGRLLLEKVVDRLADSSESYDSGMITWLTEPQYVSAQSLERYPDGWYNLGMAHGVPGCLRLLVEAIRQNVRVETASQLINGIVPWVDSHFMEVGGKYILPSFIKAVNEDGAGRIRQRLAWCYNELGATTALVEAAQVCNRPDWLEKAHKVLGSTLGGAPDDVGCVDAGLCHGAAGIAHIYHRLGKDLDNEQYRSEARRWFDITLDFHTPGRGCGGYAAYTPDLDGKGDKWEARLDFLSGSTGIALALLSATFDVRPGWDRLLGLS